MILACGTDMSLCRMKGGGPVVGGIMASQDVHTLIPGTYESVTGEMEMQLREN